MDGNLNYLLCHVRQIDGHKHCFHSTSFELSAVNSGKRRSGIPNRSSQHDALRTRLQQTSIGPKITQSFAALDIPGRAAEGYGKWMICSKTLVGMHLSLTRTRRWRSGCGTDHSPSMQDNSICLEMASC